MTNNNNYARSTTNIAPKHPLFNGTVWLCTFTFLSTAATMTCVTTVLPQYFRDDKIFKFTVDQEYLTGCLEKTNNTLQNCHDKSPLFARVYEMEEFKNGFIFALASFMTILIQPSLANVTNRYGGRTVTTFTYPLMIIGTIGMCLLQSFSMLCLARLFQAAGLQMVSFLSVIDEVYKNHLALKQTAVSITFAGWAAGNYILPALTGSLYTMSGKFVSFGSLVILQVVLYLFWLLAYILQRRKSSKLSSKLSSIANSEKTPLLNSQISKERTISEATTKNQLSYHNILGNRHQIAVQLYLLVSYADAAFVEPQLSNMMHDIEADFDRSAILDIIFGLRNREYLGMGPYFISRYPHKRWTIINMSAVVMTTGCAVVACVHTFDEMRLSLLLVSGGQAVVDPMSFTLSVDIATNTPDGGNSGPRAVACSTFSYYAGFALGGLGGGLLAQYTSMEFTAISFTFMNCVIIIYALIVSKTCKLNE